MAASGGRGPASGPFDLSAYIDSLGVMAPEQRALVDDAMTLVQDDSSTPAFLRDVALYLTTLVLVGDVTTFDDDTWQLIDTLRSKHHGGSPEIVD
jgi:hypothetical protein